MIQHKLQLQMHKILQKLPVFMPNQAKTKVILNKKCINCDNGNKSDFQIVNILAVAFKGVATVTV